MPLPKTDGTDGTNEIYGTGLAECRWLVFDAVGTLIDPDPPVAAAYHAVGQRFGSHLSREEIGRRFRAAFRASESDGFPGGPDPQFPWQTSDAIEEARWRWIVRDVLPDVVDHESCFRELWDHFARPASWRCFDDVAASLVRISQSGYRLAVASNFDRRLHGLCDSLSELVLIESRIVSTSIGARKPAPGFYAAIVDACQCPPHQILMIGDNHDYDVLAPRTAGLKSIHLDRKAATSDASRITSLHELVSRLCR